MVSTSQSPTQSKPRGGHDPAAVPLAQYRDGSIFAMSLSEPGKVYAITLSPITCTCKGFTYRGQCCHATAAAQRFAPPCLWCESRENVEVFDNAWDNSTIALRAACFSPEAK